MLPRHRTELCRQLQVSMLDKADVRHVDAKIEQKYQEVVDHLQKAISAAADDEVEFKRVATELQLTVKQLMNSKADQKYVATTGGQGLLCHGAHIFLVLAT